jgi:hypothetical protein
MSDEHLSRRAVNGPGYRHGATADFKSREAVSVGGINLKV